MPPKKRSNRDQTTSDFFIQFPDFTPNPTATLADDFHRLADHRGWTRNSKRWRKMWNQLANLEYDRLIGSTLISLDSWRGLCVEVGLEGGYPSITKCKTALSQVFVNIIDLLDSRRAGTQVRTFRSRRKLAEYTKSRDKFL